MFEELADGVFRRRYESLDLNVGVVLGEHGILVIDTRASHVEADELREELGSLTTLPVRWVVDTHWHWDHTFGNARFPEAEIWGHELCRKTMVELGDSMKEDAAAWLPDRLDEIAEVVITPPTSVFDTAASIDLGPVVVEMTYHGRGHTDSDIVVTHRRRVLHGRPARGRGPACVRRRLSDELAGHSRVGSRDRIVDHRPRAW